MMSAVSIHALERLAQRRGVVHLVGHLNKVKRTASVEGWETGTYSRKGWRYVLREGVLITVLPPKRRKRMEEE